MLVEKRRQSSMPPCYRKQGVLDCLGLSTKVPKGFFGQGIQVIGAVGKLLSVTEFPKSMKLEECDR